MHCAFARDGKRCFLHGTEKEYRAEIVKGGSAEKAALRLNCYSSSSIKFPLAAQSAEGRGALLICLRTLLYGFWVVRVSHDQDAHIGKLYRRMFGAQECFDRAHIAVSPRLEPHDYYRTSFKVQLLLFIIPSLFFFCFLFPS